MKEMAKEFSDCGRREFLKKIAFTCPLVLGFWGGLIAKGVDEQGAQTVAKTKHKFQDDMHVSYEQAFQWGYAEILIPALRGLQQELGKLDFIALLKKTSEIAARHAAQLMAQEAKKNDFATYMQFVCKTPDPIYDHALTFTILKEEPGNVQAKVSECLWAKTFRETGAADLGYALICYGDFANAEAFNPKLKLIRTKTLMEGRDCCNHHWIMNA